MRYYYLIMIREVYSYASEMRELCPYAMNSELLSIIIMVFIIIVLYSIHIKHQMQ